MKDIINYKELEIDEEGQASFELAKAVQEAMFDGKAGKLIDFDKIDTNILARLVTRARKVIDWRRLPNENRGGH